MLLHGTKHRKPAFVMAYMVIQMIGLVIAVICTVLLLVIALYFAGNAIDESQTVRIYFT